MALFRVSYAGHGYAQVGSGDAGGQTSVSSVWPNDPPFDLSATPEIICSMRMSAADAIARQRSPHAGLAHRAVVRRAPLRGARHGEAGDPLGDDSHAQGERD